MTVEANRINKIVWRNNALLAASNLLACGIMTNIANHVNTTVLGSNAISQTRLSEAVGCFVFFGGQLIEHRLPFTNSLSIGIGEVMGGATVLLFAPEFGLPISALVGATTAALVAGRVAVEVKQRFPNGLNFQRL